MPPPPPPSILIPPTRIPIEPLTPHAFLPFGTVVENPLPTRTIPTHPLPPTASPANQGTALKYSDISPLSNTYAQAPSAAAKGASAARATMSLFVSWPRPLLGSTTPAKKLGRAALLAAQTRGQNTSAYLPVPVLERHPYTSQTFTPVGLDRADAQTCYLVVVAPSSASGGGGAAASVVSRPPVLERARAFVAHGGQAVTYAAGTWHAPMVVLGGRAVEFVVLQWVSGVAGEDCEEVALVGGEGGGLSVGIVVPGGGDGEGLGRAKI